MMIKIIAGSVNSLRISSIMNNYVTNLNWNARVNMTSPYTVPSPGYIICSSASNNGSLYVAVNGLEIARNAGQAGDWVDSVHVQLPVYTNDSITFYVEGGLKLALFVPMS